MSRRHHYIQPASGWRSKRLQECCALVSRGKAPSYVERSTVRAVGQRCVTDSGFDGDASRPHDDRRLSGMLLAEAGDVLLNSTGTGTIGRSCVFSGAGTYIIDGHVTVLRSEPEQAEAAWINALLRHPLGQRYLECQCYSGSTNQVELSRDRLAGTCVPLPPLPEQRRIAEILDTVDEAIRRTEEVIAKLQQVKQGLLHDLLTRGIDDNGELRDPDRHPDQFHDTPLGRVPRGWEVVPLQDVTDSSVDGPFGSNLKSDHYVESPGVRVVRLQNIGTGVFLDQEKAWVSESHARTLARHDAIPGDVLIASLGDPTHPFARSCLYPEGHAPGIVKADCFRFRLNSLGEPRFVSDVFNTPRWRRGLAGLARRSGVSRDRINLTKLRHVPIPLPPVSEQREVVIRLLAHEACLDEEERELSKLRQLKSGLMDDLLTGCVRVKVPAEEARP